MGICPTASFKFAIEVRVYDKKIWYKKVSCEKQDSKGTKDADYMIENYQKNPIPDKVVSYLFPNLHSSSIPAQKISVDRKARSRYQDWLLFPLN